MFGRLAAFLYANGRRVLIGGATSGMNQVTRQVLGYRQQQSQSESSFILSATIQR